MNWILLKNKFTGDEQEFAPCAVPSVMASGVWVKHTPATTPKQASVPANVLETASQQPGILERIMRPIFQRGPSSRA